MPFTVLNSEKNGLRSLFDLQADCECEKTGTISSFCNDSGRTWSSSTSDDISIYLRFNFLDLSVVITHRHKTVNFPFLWQENRWNNREKKTNLYTRKYDFTTLFPEIAFWNENVK